MKIVGYKRTNKGGYMVWCTEDSPNVTGCVTDSFFMPDRVCDAISYIPSIGDNVIPVYKRNSRFLDTVVVG